MTTANSGDHATIFQFLTACCRPPAQELYLAALDDPFYEPNDRLLVKVGHQIIAHLHVVNRVMQFGPLEFPVAGLSWLATLPECRSQGYAHLLLAAADRSLRNQGAILGLLRTKLPHFFRPAGWAVCGRHSVSRAGARIDGASHIAHAAAGRGIAFRMCGPWRQVELPALLRLHGQTTGSAIGALERTEAYWRWLLNSRL